MNPWRTLHAWLRQSNVAPLTVLRSLGAATLAQLAANALAVGAPLLLCLAWTQHDWDNPLTRIAIPLVIIELMAFFRSPLRFLDRMTSHRLGFVAVTQWRVWLTRRVAQWSTRSTNDTARAELLQQSLHDIDQLQDVWLRVVLPLASSLLSFVLTVAGVVVAFALELPTASSALWVVGGLAGAALAVVALLASQLERAVDLQRAVRRVQHSGFGELFDRHQLAAELALLGSAAQDPHFDAPNLYNEGLSSLARYEAWWRRVETSLGALSAILAIFASFVAVTVVVTPPQPATPYRVGLGVVSVLLATLAGDLFTQWRQSLHVAASVVVTLEALEARGEHSVRQTGSNEWPDDVTEINVQDVFACTPGARIAITGPSGSGKSTWLRSLAGLEHAGASVMVNGTYLHTLSDTVRHHHVGFVPTEPHFLGTSLHDEMALGRAELLDYRPMLEKLGLAPLRDRKIVDCSRGDRHRYALVRALIAEPDILLLDEPTAGLGEHERGAVLDLLWRSGATLIVATHDPAVAAKCDIVIPFEAFKG